MQFFKLNDDKGQAIRMNNCELTFIIPTLNEEEHIGGVLDAIKEQVANKYQYEVVVVDNGSRDRTVEISLERGAKCLRAPGCTISTLRNKGVEEANSEIIVFLDADVYLGKDWGENINRIIEKLHGQTHIITGSLYGISAESNWIERIWFAPRTTRKEINYINGGHIIIHKSLFTKVGGFDPDLETGEDCDFCARGRRMNAVIENDPDLKVVHAGYPKNIKRFFARERWHARGDYKSFKTLFSSKPALVSLANLCFATFCSIGLVVSSKPWHIIMFIYLIFLTGVSVTSTIHRFYGEKCSGLMRAVFLYMVYFTARTVSLVDIIIMSVDKRFVDRSKYTIE